MTTIQLTDAQLAQFTASGLIVVDGEPCDCVAQTFDHPMPHVPGCPSGSAPELWRKLTDPCPTCAHAYHKGSLLVLSPKGRKLRREPCPAGCAGGRQVVTLTTTCATTTPPCWRHAHAGVVGACFCPSVVTLGRFTIRLIQIAAKPSNVPEEKRPVGCPMTDYLGRHYMLVFWGPSTVEEHNSTIEGPFDPLPQPGQWVVWPEEVK